jgi:hypothetical protein
VLGRTNGIGRGNTQIIRYKPQRVCPWLIPTTADAAQMDRIRPNNSDGRRAIGHSMVGHAAATTVELRDDFLDCGRPKQLNKD